ncbi:MAG: hypothetical protein ACYTFG_19985, partial [Planctomycetota bacterium]
MIPGTNPGPGGMQKKEMRSILFMAGVALVLLMALVAGLFIGDRDPKESQVRSQEEEKAPPEPSIGILGKGDEDFLEKKATLEYVEDPGDSAEEKDRPKNEVKPFVENRDWDEDVIDRDENLEPEAFYYLIHRAATLTEAQIREKIDPKIDSNVIALHSSKLRGRPVRIRGTLIAMREKDFEENQSGIRRAYIGQMFDNHNKVLSFYILDLPPEAIHWKPFKDVIEVNGLYYKIWRYRNRKNIFIESPLILARTAKKIQKYPRQKPIRLFGVDLIIGKRNVTWAEVIISLLVIVMIPTLFLLVRSERRRYEAFKRTQTQKKMKAAKGFKAKEGREGGNSTEGSASDGDGGSTEAPKPEEGTSEPEEE